MAKKIIEEKVPVVAEVSVATGPTQKETLLALYKTLQDLNIRSLSDLENLIARS